MKQRLAIGAALLGNPEVLLFDEPTNGLDPVGIAEIRELIKELSKQGKTIIMASHLLDEVEKVCTHVAIMKRGVLITAGPVEEVLAQEDIIEVAAQNLTALQLVLKDFPGISSIKHNDHSVSVFFPAGTAQPEAINQYCFNHGVVINQLIPRKKSLETKFFELTND